MNIDRRGSLMGISVDGFTASGKGSMGKDITSLKPSKTLGIDMGQSYRELTVGALLTGTISAGMSDEEIKAIMETQSGSNFQELLLLARDQAATNIVHDALGDLSLYGPIVDGNVSRIGRVESVQRFLIGNAQDRLREAYESSVTGLAVVDGRRVRDTIFDGTPTTPILDVFARCGELNDPDARAEVARRLLMRQKRRGISPDDQKFQKLIEEATKKDLRDSAPDRLNAVRPPENAIIVTAQDLPKSGDVFKYAKQIGGEAFCDGRSVIVDTFQLPLPLMKPLARGIATGALKAAEYR